MHQLRANCKSLSTTCLLLYYLFFVKIKWDEIMKIFEKFAKINTHHAHLPTDFYDRVPVIKSYDWLVSMEEIEKLQNTDHTYIIHRQF